MNIQDNRPENEEISVICESSDQFSTFGGEYWADGYEFAEYGLDMGDICFYNLSPDQMKQLGLQIINHLMTCGHQFEILQDYNGEYLSEKS
jgi:hypothetical protein